MKELRVIIIVLAMLSTPMSYAQSNVSKPSEVSIKAGNVSNSLDYETKHNWTVSKESSTKQFTLNKNPYLELVNPNEKRVALVIGNSHYKHSATLKNPQNDANDMAVTLSKIGFDVTKLIDADFISMRNGLKKFEAKIKDADVVMCYYAGHGIQVEGKNYLIPIDAVLNEKAHIKYETIDVGMITNIMELSSQQKRLNMVILDACRNNPFRTWSRGGNDGLVKIDPPNGTIIAYATSPNSVASDGSGENGLYTGELIKQLLIPQRIEDVFINTRVAVEDASNHQQSPWEQAKLRSAYYLLKSK